jgi:GTPase
MDMTKQHYKMLISHNIPIFIIITRIDVSPENAYTILMKDLKSMCKSSGGQKVDFINTYDDYHQYLDGNMTNEEFELRKKDDIEKITDHMLLNSNGKQVFVPVITVSNVTGYYIDVAKSVMSVLPPRDLWDQNEHNNRIIKVFKNKLKLSALDVSNDFSGSIFYIDGTFNKEGIGLIVSGILRGDTINVNDTLYLGPIGKEFTEVKIRSMHNDNKEDIQTTENHGRGCFAIAVKNKKFVGITKDLLNKGSILVTPNLTKFICYRFQAAIFIYSDKSISVKPGYSPVIHLGTIRQCARVLNDDTFEETIIEESKDGNATRVQKIIKKVLGPRSVSKRWIKFIAKPEFVEKGSTFTFRSGHIHGIGLVLDRLPIDDDDDAKPDPKKKISKRRNIVKEVQLHRPKNKKPEAYTNIKIEL